MDNYLAELAKSRGRLLDEMMSIGWSYNGRSEKVRVIQEEISKIDSMIDKVIEPPLTPKEPKANHKKED